MTVAAGWSTCVLCVWKSSVMGRIEDEHIRECTRLEDQSIKQPHRLVGYKLGTISVVHDNEIRFAEII
jgi:hypothetical protein